MNTASMIRSFRRSQTDPNLSAIFKARRLVVVTGAGISEPSGLPPVSGQGALTVPEGAPRNVADLAQRPDEVFDYFKGIAAATAMAQPNAAHRAITICQERMKVAAGELTLFTLNTDDLHELANSQVHHVYGQLSWERCTQCGTRSPAAHKPTTCGCGGARRPDVSLEGEINKSETELAFKRTMRRAEAIICIGTSGASDTVRRWVRAATDHYGAPSLLLTKDPEEHFGGMFGTVIEGEAEEIRHFLPR
jgi:NAD-dependent deacetylase